MRITDNEVRDCIAKIDARPIGRDSRRGKPYDGVPSARNGEIKPITEVGLAKVLGTGNPLEVGEPDNQVPRDPSGVTTQRKRPGKRPAGEQGRGPIVKGVTKSPSESVGDGVSQTSQLYENPFDGGDKPAKQNKKKAGNPADKNGPGALKENTHVDAEAVRPLNDMEFRRFPRPEVKGEADMSATQRALWNWSQK
jgi:hypothetical protein